jgi:hypothetical protein
MDKRYFKCYKCGALTETDNGEKANFMCCASMPVRISGICGGGFSIEITKDEYTSTIKKWENDRLQRTI